MLVTGVVLIALVRGISLYALEPLALPSVGAATLIALYAALRRGGRRLLARHTARD